MDKFFPLAHAQTVHGIFHEILHSFDVVVGHLFLVLDPLRIGLRKLAMHLPQRLLLFLWKICQLRQRHGHKLQEILNFNLHAVLNQSLFRQPLGERLSVTSVTAIDGRKGVQHVGDSRPKGTELIHALVPFGHALSHGPYREFQVGWWGHVWGGSQATLVPHQSCRQLEPLHMGHEVAPRRGRQQKGAHRLWHWSETIREVLQPLPPPRGPQPGPRIGLSGLFQRRHHRCVSHPLALRPRRRCRRKAAQRPTPAHLSQRHVLVQRRPLAVGHGPQP